MKTSPISSPSPADSMQDNDLHALFLDELADTLHAEHQLTKALPKMIKAAEGEELVTALEAHLDETQEHIVRLEETFDSLGEKPRKKPCKGMQGIIEEGAEMIREQKKSPAIDAAIIAAGQKAEHYEIASYGTLIAWAKQMGHERAIRLLHQTLVEEKAADGKLTEIALSNSNCKAEQAA